jgi:hypothetical protein
MRTLCALFVVVLLLALLPSAALAAPVTQPQRLPGPCQEWGDSGSMHHTLSQWTSAIARSGGFKAWKSGSTVAIAFYVSACGAWMFTKFRAGVFTTNFFPSRGMAYITEQVRGWQPVALSIVRAAIAAAGGSISTMSSMLVSPILIPASEMCKYAPTLARCRIVS